MLCDTLQAMVMIKVEMVHQASILYIESNLKRLGCCRLFTASALRNIEDASSNPFRSTNPSLSRPHAIQKIRESVVPKYMAAEALSP